MVTVMMIAETVGRRDVLRERPADYSAVARRTREELPYAALAAVAKRYRIPLATLARVIGLPERTLARRKKERRLRADESDRLLRVAWWLCAIPGVAILLTVLAINLVGEGLNDALNPRLRR